METHALWDHGYGAEFGQRTQKYAERRGNILGTGVSPMETLSECALARALTSYVKCWERTV